jgi:hypothetical protein
MSKDLKAFLQQIGPPNSVIASYLRPSQRGAVSSSGKKANAAMAASQKQIQQLDTSRIVNIQQFIKKLPSFPQLKTLDLSGKNIDLTQLFLLSSVLPKLPNLKYINLCNNDNLDSNFFMFDHVKSLSKVFPDIHFRASMFLELWQGPGFFPFYFVYYEEAILELTLVNNKEYGQVIIYSDDSCTDILLQGNMVNGILQGPAVISLQDGGRIIGDMVNGEWQGQVTKQSENGQKQKGRMVNDQFVRI